MSKKIYNLGKVKGRTPEFRLTEKILEIKYDDETVWSTFVDFSTIASSFDLRLNEETFFLEAQREVDGEWEEMVDLSALKLAHEHSNKDVLDKITSSVFEQTKDAISKRHKHDNVSALNEITNEHIENIDKIPKIEEDVAELVNNPTKQLVEGIFYTDKNKKGFSANKNAVPTADSAWIIGEASNYHSFDEAMTSAALKVVTTTQMKSTTITVTIEIVCVDSDVASWLQTTINTGGYHIGIVFEDTPDKTYYIKASSVTVSSTTVSVKFTFIDGQDTFPITGDITRTIQSVYFYPKNGRASSAEGLETIAASDYSHVQGKYNEIDTEGKYAHIVGNGTAEDNRSNAHTLDWEGNAWYAGEVKANSFSVEYREGLAEVALRTTMLSSTIDGWTNWCELFPLEVGSWYAITIDGVENVIQCSSADSLSSPFGDSTFYIQKEDFNPPDEIYMYRFYIKNPSGSIDYTIRNVTIEKLVLDLFNYIKSVDDKTTNIEADSISVAGLAEPTRNLIYSNNVTLPFTEPYNNNGEWGEYLLKVGNWYAVIINNIEHVFQCEINDSVSLKVGGYTFSISPNGEPEYWPPQMHISVGGAEGEQVEISVEELIYTKVDLVDYINSLDTGLTEEQATDLAANTEARHEHENKDVLDTITVDMLLTATQKLAIDNDTVPFVTELPTNAKYGDMCRYARANNLSVDDAGKTIYFSYNWLNHLQPLGEDEMYNFSIHNTEEGTAVSVDLYPMGADDVIALTISDSYRMYSLVYRPDADGVFSLITDDPDYFSYYSDENGIMTVITEAPKSFQIPQGKYDVAESYGDALDFVLFYHETKLMIYSEEWGEFPSNAEIEALAEARHIHENKDVLENFTEDTNGKLLYKGNTIGSSTGAFSVMENESGTFSLILGGE